MKSLNAANMKDLASVIKKNHEKQKKGEPDNSDRPPLSPSIKNNERPVRLSKNRSFKRAIQRGCPYPYESIPTSLSVTVPVEENKEDSGHQDSGNHLRNCLVIVIAGLCFVCILVLCIYIGINKSAGPGTGHTIPLTSPMNERFFKVTNIGKFEEFENRCKDAQRSLPDLPVPLEGSVHTFIEEIGVVLVCGGRIDGGDYDPRTCYTNKLDGSDWENFPYKLSTNRIYSFIEYDKESNTVQVIGGESSDPSHLENWYLSKDVLNTNKLSDGWTKEGVKEEFDLRFPTQILKVPCMELSAKEKACLYLSLMCNS